MMLQTERMDRLVIVGPKSQMAKVIESCYALNVYHIVDHQKTAELDLGAPLENAEPLSEILLKLRSVIAHLDIHTNGKITTIRAKRGPLQESDYFALGQKARELYEAVNKILAARKRCEEELTAVQRRRELLGTLADLHIDPTDLAGTTRIAVLIGTIPITSTLRALDCTVTESRTLVGGRQSIVLAIERTKEAGIRQQLSSLGFTEIDCSDLSSFTGSADQEFAAADARMRALQREVAEHQRSLTRLGTSEEEYLLLNESLLAEEIHKAEAPLKFGVTKSGFQITGWVPRRRTQEVIKDLNQVTHERIHIEVDAVHHEQEVPVLFKNPKPARPFQFFLEMFALPSYHEIDPTTLMLFTFPLFFGFMLGDVGYGALSLVLFLFLKQKLPKDTKPLLNIMLYAAVVSILFGFAFGEYLGFEHVSVETGEKLCGVGICLPYHEIEVHGATEAVADFPRLLNRMHGEAQVFGFTVPAVLVIGAIIGLLHLNLGLFLGFLNGWHHQGFLHGLLEKAGWWMLQIAVALFAAPAFGYPIPTWTGIAALIAAAALLYIGEGIQGLIEMPAILSNTLSYMRLGAVGLASVGLATVVNEQFFLPLVEAGGISILFGIIIMILGHAVNLLLGIIGPFLHALRLHYVEFFTKFYKGGGAPYLPFGRGE